MITLRQILLALLLLCSCSGFAQQETRYESMEAALEQARQSNDYEELASAYYNLALYEEEENTNLERSFEQLSRSLEYYELTEDTIGTYKARFHIARQLLANGMYEDAFNRLKDVKAFYSETRNKQMLAEVDLQFFDYFFEKLDVKKANVALNNVKKLIGSDVDKDLEFELLSREIAYNDLMQDYEEALDKAELCLEKSLAEGRQRDIARCYFFRGKIYNKKNDPRLSNADLMNSTKILSKVPYSRMRLDAYKLLSENHRAMGNFKMAFDYAESYSILQDSILNENRLLAINNLTYKYESKEKATEIKLLEQDKAFVQKSNQQQKRALVVLGIAMAGLLLGIYYIISFYSDKIRSAKIIEEQNVKINEQRINELQDKLQINSMQSMIAGQEEERERIAKDLHDSLGGLLSTIKLQIGNIHYDEADVDKRKEFTHATNLIDIAVSEIRTISQDLQPGALKRLGLVSAINDLVNRYQTDSGPEITFQHYGLPKDFEQSFAMGIYRIVQEILNNALKHAQATEIFVQLNKESDDIVIHIEDDGIGFDATQKFTSMGLENIKSRVNYLKGTMDIDSRIGQGSSFIIHLNSKFKVESPH